MTVAPAGIFAAAASPTLSMRLPRMTMTWSRRGVADFPSISVPARITVTASALPRELRHGRREQKESGPTKE